MKLNSKLGQLDISSALSIQPPRLLGNCNCKHSAYTFCKLGVWANPLTIRGISHDEKRKGTHLKKFL